MFAKLSALLLALPFVSALTINPLTGAVTAGTVTVTWTASTSDPAYFSIELVNTDFHNTFAIANNVQTSLGTLTLELPQVPAEGGYSLEAIATNDINTVYSQSGTFDISDSSSSSSSLTTPSTTPTSTSTTSTGTLSSTSTLVTPTSSVTHISSSTSSSSSSSSPSPSTFSSGAAAFKLGGVAPMGAAALAVVAGAAMVF